MNIKQRLNYVLSIAEKIGFFSTLNYLTQRKIKPPGVIIKVRVRGLPHHVHLRNKTYDIHIFYQIFISEHLRFTYSKDVSTIFDCGANMGLATLYYHREFPKAKIISIEPEVNNYALLKRNTSFYPGIICLKTGVYGFDGDLYLLDSGEGEAAYQIRETDDIDNSMGMIACRGIDSLMEEYSIDKIDILKMDIEGSEAACFLSPNISWIKKTRYILVEIHELLNPGITTKILDGIGEQFTKTNNGEYFIFENTEI